MATLSPPPEYNLLHLWLNVNTTEYGSPGEGGTAVIHDVSLPTGVLSGAVALPDTAFPCVLKGTEEGPTSNLG